MKKTIGLLLMISLVFSLTSCLSLLTRENKTTIPDDDWVEESKTVEVSIDESLPEGVRPEVKEALDEVEEFIDEYCEFMEDYLANPNDSDLMSQYTKFLLKYAEISTKLAAIDDGTLSEAEQEYYQEVFERISKKVNSVKIPE